MYSEDIDWHMREFCIEDLANIDMHIEKGMPKLNYIFIKKSTKSLAIQMTWR